MSRVLVHQYLKQLSNLKKVSGTSRETVVREAFKDLLKAWGRSSDLTFVPEYKIETKTKDRRYVDGALLHTLRVPFGYWEAKDEKDDIDAEIEAKFRRGYPRTNIIFEDSSQAVLIQHGEEIMRCGVDDVPQLEKLLTLFFGYERPEIEAFRKAVEQFKTDLPDVLEALRSMIEASHKAQSAFRAAAGRFLTHAQEAINPNLTEADVREMLIQHILTGEVFSAVFPGTTYHEDNSIARELHRLEETFFTGNTKHQTLKGLAPYYGAIRRAATEISTHHEKQTFLKAIYENFYKVYNPKAADRLGVIYTPSDIVRFMIEGADWLCEKHFKKNLIDRHVDILDPATGTGTFICELIEHFAGNKPKLAYKYQHELHANEVAILPYYVANLNIEATYSQVMEQYQEFPGLCFVDTLDNTYALRKHAGHMDDLFGSVTDDNVKRIRHQNSRRISVIIGNPPYNANQLNENENNKNREYPEIDKRIRETYIAESTAQKTKLYDMYARFLRWASDRVDADGIVAFISNNSFVDSRTFDGFRKCVANEFNEVWVIDLKGNARTSGERRRLEGGNVFDDQIRVGVAVYFLVRRRGLKGCRIYYDAAPDKAKAHEKRTFLSATPLANRPFTEVKADKRHNWINNVETDFDTLMPLVASDESPKGIFNLRTNGVNTARDEWVYDFDKDVLLSKARYAVEEFNRQYRKIAADGEMVRAELSDQIKWSEGLINKVQRGLAPAASKKFVVRAQYRPFVAKYFYADSTFSDRLTSLHAAIFGERFHEASPCIAIAAPGQSRHFGTLASDTLVDWHFLGDTQMYPLFTVSERGREENISDWALRKFKTRYLGETGAKGISKKAIFYYVYAVLHDPKFRHKYQINLSRNYPRIPLYSDFARWVEWGERLMDLHIGYLEAEPFQLTRVDVPDAKARSSRTGPKCLLKADKPAGALLIDSETTLIGVPADAWEFKFGSRSALEWVLEQYREGKANHHIIRERFGSYRLRDYKDAVIDLLQRVTAVSISTNEIVAEMKGATKQRRA